MLYGVINSNQVAFFHILITLTFSHLELIFYIFFPLSDVDYAQLLSHCKHKRHIAEWEMCAALVHRARRRRDLNNFKVQSIYSRAVFDPLVPTGCAFSPFLSLSLTVFFPLSSCLSPYSLSLSHLP